MSNHSRIDLSTLDEAFAQASVPGAEPVPDGAYMVESKLSELNKTRHTGRPMLCWTLRVLTGPFADRRLWRRQVLGPRNLGWLKKDLRLCNLELARLSELPDHLERLSGIPLEITKTTRDDYESILFRRRAKSPRDP
jgi:hypothetical protein